MCTSAGCVAGSIAGALGGFIVLIVIISAIVLTSELRDKPLPQMQVLPAYMHIRTSTCSCAPAAHCMHVCTHKCVH